MDERLRFGIVGCGVIGPTHADAITSLPDAELVAVADSEPDRAEKMADRYGVRAHTDLGEMLEREQLDVVNICTPSGMHGKEACQVMRSGRHVIVEKPMDIRLETIDEMLRVQQEAGVTLSVISQKRFDPSTQRVRALVEEGAFGRLVLGSAQLLWWRAQEYYNSGSWRGTLALDCGVLMNQAIHSIDLLQWLMGPVHSVRAYTDTLVHQMEAEDVAVAALRFANGALGTIVGTTGAYPGVTSRVELFGDRGSAIIEDDELSYLHLARDEQGEVGAYGIGTKHHAREEGDIGTAQQASALSYIGHARQIADVIRAIREDGTPLIDGHEGRRSVQIILGIYESARTGNEVVLS